MKVETQHGWTRPKKENGHWVFWFFEPTYRENIHIIWPCTELQRREYVTRHFGISDFSNEKPCDWEGKCTEVIPDERSDETRAHLLAFSRWENDARGNSILAHEVFHLTNHILSVRGVPCGNDPTDENEAYAYLLQALMFTCHQALQSTAKRKRK